MKNVNVADKNQIAMIHTLLKKNAGDLYADIWKIGLNLSLRIGDLLKLKYADLDLEKRELRLTETKTGKTKCIRLNPAAVEAILRRLKHHPDVYLFQVNCSRAKNKPISRVAVSKAFKEAGDVLGLAINTHSMRKSRGMAMFRDGVPVEKIAKVLNHSNTSSTLRYLGITQEEVLKTYDDYEL